MIALLLLLFALPADAREPLASFAPLIREAEPAVVNVSTVSPPERRDPRTMEEFLNRFLEPPGPRRGMGTGFVISADGEIVTNAHVVQGAERVRATLAADESVEARVVGTDPMTDVALLRIEAPRRLPTLPLGDSDRVAVGDWVLAIGNPFGLDKTATAGIVSAKGRFIGAGPYDDFIQTDAAINPGNSGGPLLDETGRVVGVNAAIVSPAGGSVGIGFAIPSNLVKWVVDQLREHGRVVRGWLGVAVQRVTPDLARAFDLERPHGALVAEVTAGGPAAAAGLRRGDVIVRLGERAIEESRELPAAVASTPPGTRVPVTVRRRDGERTITVTVAEMPAEAAAPGGRRR